MVVTRHQLRDIYLTAYAIMRVVREKPEPGETLA